MSSDNESTPSQATVEMTVTSPAKIKEYPEPLASHEVVVKDSSVFWDTLRRFHSIMSTKFMIPVIGGKELDLHVLYVEVTRRGGYEKVVAEKKWREVGGVFRFSATTTSASFVLRKHYLNLLFHYEQVHLFTARGPLLHPTATFHANPSTSKEMALVEYTPPSIRYNNTHPPSQGSSSFTAIGTIEGKFDCGYLVKVKLGSEILNGVLYHSAQPGPSSSPTADLNGAVVPYVEPGRRRRRLGKRRRSRRREDPNYPKPNRSGYNFFFAEKHCKLKSLYPNKEREFTKIIGESWSNLSTEERMVYQDIGLKDKERYQRELNEYRETLRLRDGDMTNGKSF
ncbi:ARID DNA-binding domain [Arabidopsis thaliana x Arabidopsis arenosa]|uniref:ARID DNA-binding domain n=1 Tax=Arabidopsis thaliana x Arabidopsis arenosa TaxID=1240361 RepID=A0A8T2BK44_9BRAS|nr:ARID DNA-binding domain [Arabidopsis thaliana x Arabidopsis arenosa]